jgi:glycerol uptake facilitator protein
MMSPYVAEFVGTALVITLGESVVAGVSLKGTKSEGAGFLTVVLAWGIAITLSIYAVGNISGAHFNPALTVALAVKGDFPWADVPGYVIAQFAGAFFGAILVWLNFYPFWKNTPDPAVKLGIFSTAPAVRNTWSNLFNEILATLILVLALQFIGTNQFADGLNPIIVGLLIVSIGLSLGSTTGFALNPARDLGPRIAHFLLPIHGKGGSDWGYAWIPVVGPLIGALLGVGLFQLIFA